MKSNKCLFSPAIFKSDFRRFVPYSVILLVVQLIIFPVVIYSNYGKTSPLGFDSFLSHSIASSGFAFVFAGVEALLVFSYLFSANKCNALHAFPIGRRALFTTSLTAGYVLLVLPQLLGFACGIPAVLQYSKEAGKIILMQTIAIFGESFIYYAVAVLAVMLAGNLFAGGVIYLFLQFGYPLFAALFDNAVCTFGYGIVTVQKLTGVTEYFSPAVCLFSTKMRLDNMYAGVIGEATSDGQYYISLAVLAAVAVVLLALAWLLYKKRALECAGDMTAYPAEIPVLSVLASMLCGACASMLLSLMLDFEPVGSLCAYILFAVLFFFAAQMVLRKSARVFAAKQFIICAVTVAVSFAAVFAVAQVEMRYIPSAGAVKSAAVNCSYELEVSDPAQIETVEQIHRMLIDSRKDTEKKRKTNYDSEEYLDDYIDWHSISITYTLTGGRTVQRSYSMYGDSWKEAMKLLGTLELEKPPVSVFEQLEAVDFTIESCDVEVYNATNSDTLNISGADCQKLYDLCAADAKQYGSGYQSQNRGKDERSQTQYILFCCEAKSAADLRKVEAISLSNTDVTGAGVDTYMVDDNINARTFEITVGSLSEDSKVLEFLKSK